jgi:hypothetical protein
VIEKGDIQMNHSLINETVINFNLEFTISARGRISPQSSGVITALAQQAELLEPGSMKHPVVILENDTR